MMANWLGLISRNQKGDPDGRAPVMPVETDLSEALAFVMAMLWAEAFSMTTELLHHMTTDSGLTT